MQDATRAFVPWDGDFEAMYAPGGPLDPATDPRFHGLPAYPEGDVVGACVCGSWPGGKCLRCPVTPNGGVQRRLALLPRNTRTPQGVRCNERLERMPKNPTPPLSETLQAAATLLEMEAASLKDCHTVRGRWSNHDFGAREAHDEMTRVAKALRLAHKHMQPNPLGGPARVFDAIADSIRAGDSVQLAMRAFGVKWAKRSN